MTKGQDPVKTAIVWTHEPGRPDVPNIIGRWISQHVDYSLTDAKGRHIGGFVLIEHRRPHVWKYDPAQGKSTVEPTGQPDFFEVTHNALRDGRTFGAIPRGSRVATLAEAKALGARKIAEASRRFAKLVAEGRGRQYRREVGS